MKIEHQINGAIQILLSPEDEIERTIIAEMTKRAEKGQAVTLAAKDGVMTVSVER